MNLLPGARNQSTSRKGSPPQEASNNTGQVAENKIIKRTGKRTTITFEVDSEVKKEMKVYAAKKNMDLRELFKESFDFYKAAHPVE